MKKNFAKDKVILITIITGLIIIGAIYLVLNYSNKNENRNEANQCLAPSNVLVTKVIDGDTIVVEGGSHIRLLGIDSDERGYPCYNQAKIYLEKLILNKKVRLEKDKTDVDKYERCLRYIFLNKENINLQMVKNGLAVARFYKPDIKYKDEITQAEKNAIDNKIGCKWSTAKVVQANQEKKKEFKWTKLTTNLTGLKIVPACQSMDYLNKKVIIEGYIIDGYRSAKSNVIMLNFEKPYPDQCFTAIIFNADQDKFVEKPENYYLNKTVRVEGKIKQYKNRPEIILNSPQQIEVPLLSKFSSP